jgi:serine/threonine protein kinase
VRTNGTASAPSNTSHSSFIPLQTPPTSTTANSTTTTNNNSTSTSTSTSGQNKNGNSNSRGTIEAEATNCYLCQTNFVLHRRRYCKMCLLAVCASCSDRLFLPGFSEAKRVCKGCSELQLLLHRKLPKGTIGTTGRKGITNDTTGTTGDGATTTTTNNNNTTTTSSSATTSAINTTGDGGTSITTTTTTTTTTTGGISSSTKMMASSKAFALQEAKRKMEEMRLRELKKNQSKKPLGIEDFDLLKVVGRGAFGKVLLVKKKNGKNAGNIYAMKILVKAHIIKNDQIENTKSEQHILKEINHPFIVRLRYAFQNTEKLYLVMDYYPGGSMFYHLRKSKKFTEERTRLYMAQLLTALMHLHSKQIAYRDLKLENILMDPKGNIALTDFGLSKEGQVIEGAIRASQADAGMKTICGTAEYMAPELLRHQPYGKVVDWWSYGILLFEMLTGRTPFVDRNRRQMFKNIMQAEVIYPNYISPVARSLISKLLNRDPSKRLGGGPNGGRDIMAHSFFDPIDWDKLARKEIKPTFIPKVTSVDDITNVPEMFQNMAAIDSPVNNKSTGEAHHFDDFSFQEETLLTRG